MFKNVVYLVMRSVHYMISDTYCDEPVAVFCDEAKAQKYVEEHGMDEYTYVDINVLDAD